MFFRFESFSKYRLLWIGGLWLSILSCEQVVEINQKSNQPQLWVWGLVGPDSLATVLFTETQEFDGWIEQEKVALFPKNLKPQIQTNAGSFPLFGEALPKSRYQYQAQRLLPDSGYYRLSLLYRGDSLISQVNVPPKPDISDITSEVIYLPDNQGNEIPRLIDFRLNESHPSPEVFQLVYGYRGWRETSVYDSSTQEIVLDTVYEARIQASSLIKDHHQSAALNILVYYYLPIFPEVEILPDNSERRYIPIWVVLTAYSPSLSDYNDEIFKFLNQPNDPFSEPVFTPTNIQNGLGLFAAYHSSDTTWLKIYLD